MKQHHIRSVRKRTTFKRRGKFNFWRHHMAAKALAWRLG